MAKSLDDFDAKVGLNKFYADTIAKRQAALTGKFNAPAWKDAAQPASARADQQKAAFAVKARKAKIATAKHAG